MGKPLPTNLSAGIVAGAPPLPIVPRSLEEALTLARAVVASGMAPHGLETPEACLIAILHGLEVGLTPLSALQRIAVIDGRPTIWGDGAMALVRASGLCRAVREWIEGDAPQDWVAQCEVLRRGESDPVTCRFGVEDARRAGLWGKPGPWSLYPRRMLQMRARAFALRDVFADVLGGLYLREEIEHEVVLQYPAPSKAHAIAAPTVPDRVTSPAPGDAPGQPLAEPSCETPAPQASEASDGVPPLVSEPENKPERPNILAAAQQRPRERRSRPRRERQGWVRLRAPRDAKRLRAPPPPEYAVGDDADASASPNRSQETEDAPARMTSSPEAVLQLLDDALACALDAATLSEIQEEFAQRLATLSREDVERAERITARHTERIAAREEARMRRSLSTTQRLHLFLRAQGHCQACGWRLSPGIRWEVDHIIPVALGGSDRPDNLQVLCAACHGSKTATADAPALSKAKRMQARHLGAVRAKSVIPGSLRSRFRKSLNGTVWRRARRNRVFIEDA